MKLNYKHTIYACFTGYIVQAITNNFAPLLFVTFQKEYSISLDRIALLVSFNFGIQLIIDLLASRFLKIIGYRTAVVIAHICSAAGLIALTVLPNTFPDTYTGLLISVIIYAVGGGLIEVLISPIVEACPTHNKEGAMSLLHSFYCWGQMAVVLLSTIFFVTAGIRNWRYLAVIWALIPMVNAVFFSKVPIMTLEESTGEELTFKKLISNNIFWLMMLLMFCAGSCEQSISQWASAFAETGLRVKKTIGDLAGPMAFALLMGLSRMIYAKFSEKIKLEKFMLISGILCLISYLLASLSGNPVLGLFGCALTGFSVGIMWPGTFSLAAGRVRGGGTAMFALLALAGDLGCAGGPAYVGYLSESMNGNLKAGILCAVIFPVLLIISLLILKKVKAAK